jgi:AAA domain
METLIAHVMAWPTALASLLMFGFAPGAVLRMIVLAYRQDDPRRTELLGELPNVPRVERPFWVCEQLEEALFEGLFGRIAALARRRRKSHPPYGHPRGNDVVTRYLDLLEHSIAALLDFEARRHGGQDIPYRRARSGAERHRRYGSTYWMTVAPETNLVLDTRVELNGHQGLRGQVTAIAGSDVCVRLDTHVTHGHVPATGALRRVHDDRLYRMQLEAIARLRAGGAVNPQLIRVLAGRTFLPLDPCGPAPAGMPPLTQEQREAVTRARQVRDFLLVTSPPGTGSTRTVGEIITQSARRGEHVLVAGSSNASVDNLLSALPEDISKARLARPASTLLSPGVLTAMNTVLVAPESTPEARRTLEQASVVVGTAAGITLSGVAADLPFDLLVIIGAEQVSLPDALAALASARRVVLTGDPSQLSLFVDPDMRDWLRQLAVGGEEQDNPGETMEALLTTSLFELLLAETPSSNKVVLTTQYRMPSAVADFISHNFYGGMLASPARERDEDDAVSSPLARSFTIVDTSALPPRERTERVLMERPRGSFINCAEAGIIAAIAVAEDRRGRDWAVAVPYTAQASLIRELLGKAFGPTRSPEDLRLAVGTIESFKGTEHDLVIVGCTRSNRSGAVGFLRDMRRLNVAMTRARRQLIVVGDMQTLTNARDLPLRSLMRAMVAHVQLRGEIIRADRITLRLR